ncbi:TetR/AcrR family transcriptional regulator [Glycomyces sp. NPDC047010]|uniref:TetR/AcrR family transcriptional regulator n=1 Tax=Glycomyces sp. NPDC047010 TaxID=3155023 RepID=UPI0033E56EF8
MARLTRVQQQARTRAAVLAAARAEFTEHGYAGAKVDRIADRADLTRGAVYSNFPGKRALYLAVLVAMVEAAAVEEAQGAAAAPQSAEDALTRFAHAWLARLPLAGDSAAGGRLRLRSLAGVLDEGGRDALAQIARLEALLLAVGLEACEAAPGRRVRVAELALTLLNGSGLLAELAPGFGDPLDRARACGHLARLDLDDAWTPAPPPPAEPVREILAPLDAPLDLTGGGRVDLGADGVIAVLGTARLAAAEDAFRSVGPGGQATVIVVADGDETRNLLRLRLTDLASCLRPVLPADAWRRLRVVLDDGTLTAAIGIAGTAEDTEAALRIRDGIVTARAAGPGAACAVAASD